MESVGLCIVLFKTLTSGSTIAGVSAMQIGFIIPIIFYTFEGHDAFRRFRRLSWLLIVFILVGSALVIVIYTKESKSDAWSLVGIVLVFLSMLPYLNNKIFKVTEKTVPNYRQDIQSGSINPDSSDSSNPCSTSNYHSFHSSSSGNMTEIENVNPYEKLTPPDNASAWKVLLISASFKIIVGFLTSAIFIQCAMGKMNFQDAWRLGLNWSTIDKTCRLFIAHIVTSLVAYVTAVFACRTCIDRGAFLMPLLLSSPVVYITLLFPRSCEWLDTFLDQSSMFCASSISLKYSGWAMVWATLPIWLIYGRLFWCLKRKVLLKETQVKITIISLTFIIRMQNHASCILELDSVVL